VTTTTLDTSREAPRTRDASQAMRRVARRWRYLTNTLAVVVGTVLMVWTFIPLYNMLMVSLEHKGDVFSTHIWPPQPSVESFGVVLTQNHWYLEHFWHQFYNSVYIAFMVTLLVLLIGTLTSFSVSRMRIRNGWLITNAALLTYVIPQSFLYSQATGPIAFMFEKSSERRPRKAPKG
jgi:multiple sugar transport system permease protein